MYLDYHTSFVIAAAIIRDHGFYITVILRIWFAASKAKLVREAKPAVLHSFTTSAATG